MFVQESLRAKEMYHIKIWALYKVKLHRDLFPKYL